MPQRQLFWLIDHQWVFYALAALAVVVCALGVLRRARAWLADGALRRAIEPAGLWRALIDGLLGRRVLRGDPAAGLMHAMILWGFLGLTAATVIDAVDHYLLTFLRGRIYLVFAAAADVAGVLLVVGLLWAAVRRYLQRIPRLVNRPGDLLVLAWLLLAALSGFAVEGLRLAAQQPEWAWWSFAGAALAGLAGEVDASAAYPVVWWAHALLSLGLVAALPYTKLFHALAAPASLSLAAADAEQPLPEGRILGGGAWLMVDACTGCGRCVEVCPATAAGEAFEPRALVEGTRAQVQARQEAWHCTTCRACLEVCPVWVDTPQVVLGLRRQMVEEGTHLPEAATQTLERLYKYDNPWEASRKRRTRFMKELAEHGSDSGSGEGRICYFVGCTTGVDTRAQGVARALATIFDRAGVAAATLGKKEPCCGDIARRAGELGLYEEQLEKSLDRFEKQGMSDVVTSSPHCFHTLLHAKGGETPLAVRHYVQLVHELVAAGSIDLIGGREARVTFHDPCYLGRYNRIFEAPRRVLAAIPGLELVEMEHHHEHSLCCGGGGGRMWQEELDAEVKIPELRVGEALAAGAKILVTACPLCLIMLGDACKTSAEEHGLEVIDLAELVAASLSPEAEEKELQ